MKKRSVTRWNVLLIPTLFIFLVVAEPTKQTHAAEKDSASSCEQKALQIVKKMTLDEKIVLTSGVEIYKTTGVPRLGVPALDMTDGPSGVVLKTKYSTTAFPAGVTMAATWNPKLVGAAAAAMAKEAKLEGHNVLLGPCVNIHRTPLGGRNFESISGEDPFLGKQMAPAFVRGAQSQGVLTSTKHFALNEQEFDRLNLSVDADERTLHEIYFPPFRAAVEAGTTSVMAAYNRVRGVHACTSRFLLTETLKEKWGFRGFAISDWGANHYTSASIKAGLDLEMPYVMPSQYIDVPPKFTLGLVKEAITKGEIQESDLDGMVKRQLAAMCSVGALTSTKKTVSEKEAQEILRKNSELSRQVAEEGTVLLKNEGDVLPLRKEKVKRIAIVGPNSQKFPPGGGGSSRVGVLKTTAPAEALKAVLPGVEVLTAADQREKAKFDQTAAMDAAVVAAKRSDVAVVFVGENEVTEHENQDRAAFHLTDYQSRLVQAVAQANPKTIVVLNGGGAISMDPWVKGTPAVLQAWYLGQQGSEAIAALLTGKANPSGKLPVTFEKSRESCSDVHSFPKGNQKELRYTEGLFVGYRNPKSDPLFPFGHGLSYTTFEYADIHLTKLPGSSSGKPLVKVAFRVKNIGKVKGSEVAQLYVSARNPQVSRPTKELKGFSKIELSPGESKRVTLELDQMSFSSFDPQAHDWRMDPGAFEVLVGASSADLRLRAEVNFEK